MSKLLMLKGLPASGKSTYAKELVSKGWKRVNKDDLRGMIDDGKWSNGNEEIVKSSQIDLVQKFIRLGKDVVIDDTNFHYEDFWKQFSKDMGVEFEVKFFDVPMVECIERDAKRGDKSVGGEVIERMWNQYLRPKPVEYNQKLPDCYIFDIDGTLAKMNGRSPYDYTKVHTDVPNKQVVKIALELIKAGFQIILCSGRKDECRKSTLEWLHENNIPFTRLFMRATGDDRKDSIIKKEIYDTYIKDKYNVLAVFDDRNQVVDMWRSLGLTCLQVDYGNF